MTNMRDKTLQESISISPIPLGFDESADVPAEINLLNFAAIEEISSLTERYEKQYRELLQIDLLLSRRLVSFQANKTKSIYRWCKYKEGFSASLVQHFLDRFKIRSGRLLDPFAGGGTSLFVASSLGIQSDGIELLPFGQRIIEARKLVEERISKEDISHIRRWVAEKPWNSNGESLSVNELRITRGAYPQETINAMGRYMAVASRQSDSVRTILVFALLCILETVSYTRKDGQYLRWDYRSQRKQGKRIFDKGVIPDFDTAISEKLNEIISDLLSAENPTDFFTVESHHAPITLHGGSCLNILPELYSETYDCIITSPPYCNRYDYTRTYALELALLGIDEVQLTKLRQEMLTCTVENRPKDLAKVNPRWEEAIAIAEREPLLKAILDYLEGELRQGNLNNSGIPRMVRGYFVEMACVIYECSRLLKAKAPLIMVNDNVRYAGVAVPVDLILSEFAKSLGFKVENILVLPNGKGNSSQQMGLHGRESLRKCVYVWRKVS